MLAFFSLNISNEIRDLTANNIGQELGTLGRHMGYWVDIGDIRQKLGTLGRFCGYWAYWAEIRDIR